LYINLFRSNATTMTLANMSDVNINNHQDEKDDSGIEQDNSIIYIRIAVEDQNLQKVLKFNLDDTVWSAKLKVLQHLLKVYESRCIRDYPLCQPVGYLEFKYKRRVYKAVHLMQKNINSKTNMKKFVDCIKMEQTFKVARYLERGFDPNIQITDDGMIHTQIRRIQYYLKCLILETPLTCAIDLQNPREMIMTLVNGGAHLDYRTKDGQTPLHKAAINNKKAAIMIILELGGSPNVYDEKQLTPLYYCILYKADPYCAQLLLQDHSIVDCTDENLSTEIHQACRFGLVQHIENLLFYRADINAKNTAGNTPLHVCAANNQESCARVLLFRGADTTSINKANQTPYELALVSQNLSIASIIQQHKPDYVVPYRENPVINPKRRSIYVEQRLRTNCTSASSSLNSRSQSMPKLNGGMNGSIRSHSPINDYFQTQSSRSSSPKSFSVNSDHGFGSESASHLSGGSPIVQTSIVNGGYTYSRKRLYAAAPGRKCVCIKPFKAQQQGELTLKKGTIMEILSVGEQGYLEGRSKDGEGWFPSHHVQDICVFKNGETMNDDTIVIRRDALSALMINNDSFMPRTVVLQRGKKGFGFVLRGSRDAGKLFNPTPSFPALQFLDSIEKGSNADKAGLKQNDYVLEINNLNVISMPHEECVNLIKKAGDTLALKVVTAVPMTNDCTSTITLNMINNNYSQSLPYRRKAPILIRLPDSTGVCETLANSCRSSSKSLSISNHPPFNYLFRSKNDGYINTVIEELDRTLAEYEYGSMLNSQSTSDMNYLPLKRQTFNEEIALTNMNKIITRTTPSLSIRRGKSKPVVPERESSLYDCFSAINGNQSQQHQQIYGTFRPLSSSLQTQRHLATSVPNLRHNSNSSSNEADEESSLSSLNSNQHPQQQNPYIEITNSSTTNTLVSSDGIYMTPSLVMNTSTSLTTFKGTAPLAPPPVPPPFPPSFPSSIDKVKPSDVKKRSMVKKQLLYASLNSNNNNNNNNRDSETTNSDNERQQSMPPPPPPPFPPQLNKLTPQHQFSQQPSQIKLAHEKPVITTATIVGDGNLQTEIEQARNRLKKPQAIQIVHVPKKETIQSKSIQQRPLSTLSNGRTTSSSPSSLNTPPRSTILHPSSTYTELKNIVIEDLTPSTTVTSFPPPPSPTTLRKNTTSEQNITLTRLTNEQSSSLSSTKSVFSLPTSLSQGVTDVRHDANFSSVIAQKAAEKQARFNETKPVKQIPATFFSGINQATIQYQQKSTTYYNQVSTNGTTTGNVKQTAGMNNYFNGEISRPHLTSSSSTVTSSSSSSPSQSSSLSNSPVHQQRFSHAANQLLEGLKRRTTQNAHQQQTSMIKHYNHQGTGSTSDGDKN
ncbi:unnamed protein product, partial [Didymodactylos carnosus]